MDYEIQDDIYCYPGTNVLRNKFNIKNREKLMNIERDLTGLKLIELENQKLIGRLDESYLRKIHRFLFEEIFDWAGEYRTVRISKDITTFAYPENIKQELDKAFTKLKAENYLKGMDIDKISERLAYYKSELNIIHPFREGNGRATRKFIELLAENAGYKFNFTTIEKDEYLTIMRQSVLNIDPLTKYIREQISRIEG